MNNADRLKAKETIQAYLQSIFSYMERHGIPEDKAEESPFKDLVVTKESQQWMQALGEMSSIMASVILETLEKMHFPNSESYVEYLTNEYRALASKDGESRQSD